VDTILSRNRAPPVDDVVEKSETVVKKRHRGYKAIHAGPVIHNSLLKGRGLDHRLTGETDG